MSRSEERQHLRSEDFTSLRNKSSSNSRSRSRSRSRDRTNKENLKKSPSKSPQPPLNTTATTPIPTTTTSTAQQPQSMAAIVDSPLAQPPPTHIQYNIDETTLRKFCQPYNMQELVRMLCNTAYVNRAFYSTLVSEMKKSSKWCKLFVHGLPWTTSQQTLYNVFSRFGEIVECVILKDRNGQSKGYGFINYSDAQEAINAINAGPQQIDGRMVGSDLAWKGRKNRSNNNTNNSNAAKAINNNIMGGPLAMRRLFVYSLLYSTTDETLCRVFSEHGALEEAVIIKDKNNANKSKGYGFVIYKNVCDAQKALKQPHKIIDGRTVHCSLAIDGQQQPGMAMMNKANKHKPQQNIIIHPNMGGMNGINNIGALSHVLAAQAQVQAQAQAQAQQQNAYDPYHNVLYQQQIQSLNNQLNNLSNHQSTQLLQQLLAQQIQQQQVLQSQQTQQQQQEQQKNKAPAPIHPSFP